MATSLKLYHLGELLVCEMLKRSKDRLDDLSSAAGESVGESLRAAGLQGELTFEAEVGGMRVVDSTGSRWPLDGMHRVDVLVRAPSGRGVAFEAKLGLERLTPQQVAARFQKQCTLSRHARPRLNGSMVAVLERRFPPQFHECSVRCSEEPGVEVAQDWWLVVRREVFERAGQELVASVQSGHILIFEQLVAGIGGELPFNDLVRGLVGSDFHASWGLGAAA